MEKLRLQVEKVFFNVISENQTDKVLFFAEQYDYYFTTPFTDMYPIERISYTFCLVLCEISFLITPQPLKFLKQLPVRISARWWRRRLVQFQFLE